MMAYLSRVLLHFTICGECLEKLWMLVDGIHPLVVPFVKPLPVPIWDAESLNESLMWSS
jgi:hypothetical protein